jgi:hypothetical protein
MSDDDIASMRRVFEAFREAGPDISYAFRLGSPLPSVTTWHVTYAQLQTLTNADSVNMAFLATEERYRRLRAIEGRNLVVPVVGDFAGPKAIRAVGEYLKRHDARVTAFYTSNVEQYLFTSRSDALFYRNAGALPIDSTSVFIRALPASPSPTTNVGSQVFGTLASNLSNFRMQVTDSGGVRILMATGVDSNGKAITTRIVAPNPPNTLATTSAFISGITPINRVLEAFANGQLKTYERLTAMTKTEDWKSPP